MTESSQAAGPKTVLIVEDETTLRDIAADFLSEVGFQVLQAGTAEEAILILTAHTEVTGVFTDVQMPGKIDGVDLAILIEARWPSVRILVTSGATRPSHHVLPAKAFFMAKPYLLPAVAKLLEAA